MSIYQSMTTWLHNRFNSLSEVRVKFVEQNDQIVEENWLKYKEVMSHFSSSTTFLDTFRWPFDMNMQMSELVMSSPHNFAFILYTEMTRILYFSYGNVQTYP